MLTISNTSPLLYLYLVEQLELLPALYGKITIPSAVAAELEAGRSRGLAVPDPADYGWLRMVSLRSRELVPLVTDLGLGESEAIGLALEHSGSRLILDDQLARRIAQALGIRFTGTLGVLLRAKQAGLLSMIRPIAYGLREAGLWIGHELLERVLVEAGEAPDR